MEDLKDKLRTALDEARILVLGIQVLVGFEYEAAFQKGFPSLPEFSQYLKVASLLLLLVALGLTMAPAAYHQIVERGEENPRCLGFVTGVVGIALLPFALGLGGDLYVAVQQVAGTIAGVAAAAVGVLLALLLWYGIEILQHAPYHKLQIPAEQKAESSADTGGSSMRPPENYIPTPLKDKIQFVLTETRVVLPGAQALLGFQVVIILTDAFAKLDASLKYLHLGSLFAVMASMIMLMAPASYHRLAERGRNTERLHKFAGKMVLGAMFTLALGMAGDLYLVVHVVTNSDIAALTCSLLALCFFYGVWFGYALLRRHAEQKSKTTNA